MIAPPSAVPPVKAGRLQSLGPLAMVVGYGAVGASAFALLAAGPRLLGPDGYSSLALTWTVVTIIGIGVAAPGEQTITRSIAAGSDDGVVAAVARRLTVLPVVATLLLPGAVLLLDQQVRDVGIWTSTLVVSAASWVVMACTRGTLAGRHRFDQYAATLLTESATRIVLVAVAWLAPAYALWWLAASVALPLVASAGVGLLALRRSVDLSAESFPEDSRREHLSITSVALLGQVCMSTAPLWLHWQSADEALAGAFVSATSYMRIPLLLAGGLYGPILAQAAQAYAAWDRHRVWNRTLVGVFTGVGGSSAMVFVLFVASGPALTLLYGGNIGLSNAVLLLLGLSTIGSVASNVLTQVLYGCERSPSASLAWIPPAFVTTLLFASSDGDVGRMAASMAVGQIIAVVGLLALLPRALPRVNHGEEDL